jgi:SAM-dependent methyltransferase
MARKPIAYLDPTALTEQDLAMPRRKRRSIAVSLLYRLTRAARAAGFEAPALRFFLFGSWIFWRLAYEISSARFGPAFENGARGISAELLRRHVPPGGVVLDFGCGGGRLVRLVAPFSARVYGVDRSEANIEAARRAGVPANAEYVCGDGLNVLAAREYDAVLLVHVLEHIDGSDALLGVLRGRARRVIIEVPNFAADPLNVVRIAAGAPFYSDADHVREYTPEILRTQLERNGLSIVAEEVRGASIIVVAARAE